MKNFVLFVAIVCGGASFVFYTAAREAPDGSNWASQVCKAASSLCHSLADVCCMPFLEFLPLMEIAPPPAVAAWSQRLLARPSAAATRPEK